MVLGRRGESFSFGPKAFFATCDGREKLGRQTDLEECASSRRPRPRSGPDEGRAAGGHVLRALVRVVAGAVRMAAEARALQLQVNIGVSVRAVARVRVPHLRILLSPACAGSIYLFQGCHETFPR